MLIQQAKRLGFTLAEIQQWIRDFESDQLTADEKQTILGQKLAQIDNRIEELQSMKAYLSAKLNRLSSWDISSVASFCKNMWVYLASGTKAQKVY